MKTTTTAVANALVVGLCQQCTDGLKKATALAEELDEVAMDLALAFEDASNKAQAHQMEERSDLLEAIAEAMETRVAKLQRAADKEAKAT